MHNELIDFAWNESEDREELFDESDPILHEPRALWDTTSTFTSTLAFTPGDVTAQMGERAFTNKSKYELVLTHLNFAAIAQMLAQQVGVTPSGGAFDSKRVWNSEAQLGVISFRLSGRGRQQFSYTFDHTGSYPAEPVGLKVFPTGYTVGGLDLSNAAALDNVLRFDFARPYWIPPTGGVRFNITPYAAVGVFEAQDDPPGRLTLGFNEQWNAGNRFQGHAKFISTDAARAQTGSEFAFPRGVTTGNLNGFTTNLGGQVPLAYPIAAGAQTTDGTVLTARRQKLQRENAGGASRNWITGFYVSIDQIEHDAAVVANATGQNYFATQSRIASLASRVGVAAQSFAGGTYRRWWRDFIPLPLICPQQTTGRSIRLEEPIVLAPNDAVQVEVQFPGRRGAPIFNVGVSLTGYAKVIS